MIDLEIARKLEATPDAVRMVRAGEAVGRAVVAGLAARLGLDETAPLGQQLVRRGVLSADEGAWLDGDPATNDG